MNEVFILTKENHEYGDDIYILSSSNIHDILFYMLSNQGCDERYKVFVTANDKKGVDYLTWRKF